ncbi:hypothetical protein KC963_01505, partial [Candidatus Saccharibacteria bacterium]|nr:hypothetical protein [Candidatus Saccharibacteria bacterium]
IAQDVADVVLLNNNFSLVPQIIFEGDNVIANLKFMNVLFLAKTFHAIIFALICVVSGQIFPFLPASLLIYGFMVTSLPSYVIAFFRRTVNTSGKFWSEVLPDSILASLVGAGVSAYVYGANLGADLKYVNTVIMYATLAFSLLFAIQQLWKGGYLSKWWHPVVVLVVIAVISFAASLVPFLNIYYQVDNIGVTKWLGGWSVAIVGFIVYLLLQSLFKLFADRILYRGYSNNN